MRFSNGALAVDGSCRKVTAELTSSSRAMAMMATGKLSSRRRILSVTDQVLSKQLNQVDHHELISNALLISSPEINRGRADLGCPSTLGELRLGEPGLWFLRKPKF